MRHVLIPLLVACALVPIVYVSVPIIHLFAQTGLSAVFSTVTGPEFQSALLVSSVSALISTLLALIFGLPTAFILASRRFPLQKFVEGILIIPILLPPIVGGIAQLDLYGPNSWIGATLQSMNISLTNNIVGVILAQTYITSPFLIFAAKAGFVEIPKELWDVTRVLGGDMWHQFYEVSLPLAKSAIFVGALLTFTRAIGEFGATMMMAYHPYTLPIDLWVQFSSGGLTAILPIAFFTIVIAFVIMFVTTLMRGRVVR